MEAGLLGDTDTPRGKPLADRLEGQPGLAAALAEIDAGCAAAGVSKQLTTMRWFFNHSALRPGDAIIMGASTLDQLEANLDQLCASHTPSGALYTADSDAVGSNRSDAEHGALPDALVEVMDGAWDHWVANGPARIPYAIEHFPVAKL